jgi:chromate transporter
MIMLDLFIAFFKIGLFAIGGAYSFLPLIEREVVQNHAWLEKSEFLEMLGISAIFPGAISIKLATYTGYKMAGIPGAIIAAMAVSLPPVVLILLASAAYAKYKELPHLKAAFEMIHYAVLAMIFAVGVQLAVKQQVFQPKHLIVMAAAFAAFVFTKIHPALVILGAGLLGALIR